MHLSEEACEVIYQFKTSSQVKCSYYYRYLCSRAGHPTTIPNFTDGHGAFVQTWGFLQHVLGQNAIKNHERYEEIENFSAELGKQFTFRSKQLESPEFKKIAKHRDTMKKLYTEFIQEQKYYTVLEDKLFFAKKHLELCNVPKPEADENRAYIKIEYPKQKAAMHPWYTKLRFIGRLFKKPLTEEFLNLKMQYRYIKHGEELERYREANDHSKITDTLDNIVKMRRYTDYIQKKLYAIEAENKSTQSSSKTWPQWLLSLFILSHNTTSKHEKYQNQLEKYEAYFKLLNKKHASLMQSSDSANT